MLKEEFKKIEELLLNIESINNEDKKYLKEMLVSGDYINCWDKEIVTIYNKLNSNQLSLMIDILDVGNNLNGEFASIIEDKNKLPIIPYTNQYSSYYNYILENNYIERFLLDEQFYSKFESLDIYCIKELLKNINGNEIKQHFLDKCLQYKPIEPYCYSNSNYYKHMFESNERTTTILSDEQFYSKLNSLYDIEEVLKIIKFEEQKYVFIDNCFEYKKEQMLRELRNSVRMEKVNITKYINSNKIKGLMMEQEDSDMVLELFPYLNNEDKVEVYNSEWFRNKVDINNSFNKRIIIKNSHDELIEILLNEDKKYDCLTFIDMYHESRKSIFIKKFLDTIKNEVFDDEFIMRKVFQMLFSITETKFNSLGDYQDKLINFINEIPDNVYIKLYFKEYMTFKSQYKKLSDLMYNRAKDILLSTDILIDEISPYILKQEDKATLDLIINNTPKENLLLLSIRSEYINSYVLKLLMTEPNYFNGIKIENIEKYPMLIKQNNMNLVNKFILISNYLDEEQLKIYFIPIFIRQDEKIRKYYLKRVKDNPNLLSSLEDLLLFNEDEGITILRKIDINKLITLFFNKGFKSTDELIKTISEVFESRIYEITKFLNDNDDLLEIYHSSRLRYISLFIKDMNLFIKLIDSYDFLCHYVREEIPRDIQNIVTNRLVELYNNDIEIGFFTATPHFFEKEKEREFFNKLSFEVLISMACNELRMSDSNSKDYKKYIKYITRKIDEDINVLFEINVLTKLDELLSYLPNSYQDKIKKYIDDKYVLLKGKYPGFKQYINTYTDKANYVMAVSNNLINDSNCDFVLNLLNKNKYLFNSMDFRLLNPDIMKMGKYFIDKTSRHPTISSKLIKIYEADKKKYNIICRLSDKIRKENNDNVYDEKMEIIINYFLKYDISVSDELNNNLLYNIESYILESAINRDYNYKQLNVDSYIEDKKRKIDKKIQSSNELNELKDLVYQRNFGLTISLVEEFLISYAYNWNTVVELCDNDLPSKFIIDLNNIKNIYDIDTLKSNINNIRQYTISDFLTIKSIMKTTYSKSIVNDIKNSNHGIKKNITIDGKTIEVEEITNNFGIFVHSTNAYGTMPLINNDYYESWNYNPNTKNHGICTSYITNSSYGTATVKNNGIMLGFTNIDENSIPVLAPYDLGTSNDGYIIKSYHKPFYGRLKTISDYTRHTHNETSIERRFFDKNNNSYLRQPDCIIIFEDMPENIKINSIKAYEDFKKNGIDLKIVYIDRVKNVKSEANKIDKLIKEYETTYNLEVLEHIINLYESNICSCDYLGTGKKESSNLFDQHELFQTNKIKNLLHKTVEQIESIKNTELRDVALNYYINILKNEQFKFNLINDFNVNRRHKFELLDETLKIKIEKLYEMCNSISLKK